MDMETNMNELGGAFMVGWLATHGNLEGALVLAAAWMAIGGAHILPVITWGHIMTGDLGDSDAWMANGMRLVFQVIGAALAVMLGAELAAEAPVYEAEVMWEFDMWPAMGTLAGGALLWTVYDRCDAWVAAMAVMATAGVVAYGGAGDMGAALLNSGDADMAASLANWVLDGAVAGLGALLATKVPDMV
tara:strand:+ start:2167 stop:2733 length:567 start_codon:yes stop_codon:yes gene_type:complete